MVDRRNGGAGWRCGGYHRGIRVEHRHQFVTMDKTVMRDIKLILFKSLHPLFYFILHCFPDKNNTKGITI
jgi:hypothetical protein